jgi:hypothetical protein
MSSKFSIDVLCNILILKAFAGFLELYRFPEIQLS